MNITGIVAEYNPFHNGHKYMIEQIRRQGSTHVVAVMSGAVVQRGDVAVFSKHFRAETAVRNGADLVVELPFPYSCSSGEIFAKSALAILSGLGEGVVDNLAFGCETDDLNLLIQAADASDSVKDNEYVKKELSAGKSYPAAVYESVCRVYGGEVGEILKKPNNTLGVEYIKAARTVLPEIGFIPVKRKNTDHDGSKVVGDFASASAIRNMISKGNQAESLCPYDFKSIPVYNLKIMEREILFRLSCFDKSRLVDIPDCSSSLADRILGVMSECPKTVDEFLFKCKSKNVTMARLRRILMYSVLGAKKSDFFSPPFVRILAFNKRGAEILSKCRNSVLPVDTSLKSLENVSDNARRIIHLENNAVNFQYACAVGNYLPENEYKKSVRISD
ncbi:MAG: nucleotidyltransferase family protein [Oscillospiraceae bacterium]